MIELVLIDIKQKELLENLMQLYLHEISGYFKIDFNSEICKYEYNLDSYFKNNKAYFIKDNGKIVGFILLDINDNYFEISEIFILNNYKKGGIATKAVIKLFDTYKGNWIIKTVPNSTVAESFWNKVIKEYTNNNYILNHIGKYNRAEFEFSN